MQIENLYGLSKISNDNEENREERIGLRNIFPLK